MTDDEPFRAILLAGFLLVVPVAVYHRLRAHVPSERLDRWQEGPFILVPLRLLGLAAGVGLVAYLVRPASMAWASLPLPAALRWAGVAAGLAGGLLLAWSLRSLGRNLTDTVVTRREHTLVTAGPYRWVRHPFYTAFAMLVLANSLTAANWFLGLAGGLAFALLVVRTAKEESNLIARFGEEYRAYMRRTGRFLPRARGRGVP